MWSDLHQGTPAEPTLPDAFRAANSQRLHIDRQMTRLEPYDAEWNDLWRDLQLVLAQLREAVRALAKSPANHASELCAKADVLATLLRAGAGGAEVVAEDDRAALALSLTDDIERTLGG
jgi:hypothetical protein